MRFTAAVVTISDGVSSGHREDSSGAKLEEILEGGSFEKVQRITVPDERVEIEKALTQCSDDGIDFVATTGGTGFGPRDVTPEATRAVIEREAPGLSELMRAEGLRNTPMAALSRGLAGTRARTLIVNLPGSPKGAEESLRALLPVLHHALETLRGHTQHG